MEFKKQREKNEINNLITLLLHDHDEILEKLKRLLKDENQQEDILLQIKWDIHRHIYLEEKALFSILEAKKTEKDRTNKTYFSQFFIEHNTILKKLTLLIEQERDKELIKQIIKEFNKHVEAEIKTIYPLLENITESLKDLILSQLKKSSKLGFYPLGKLRQYYGNRLNIKHYNFQLEL